MADVMRTKRPFTRASNSRLASSHQVARKQDKSATLGVDGTPEYFDGSNDIAGNFEWRQA
jgi:hypothetical protein